MHKMKIRKLYRCLDANEHNAVLTSMRKEEIGHADHIYFSRPKPEKGEA